MINVNVVEGIIVGGVGGACAGVAVYLIQFLHQKIVLANDSKTIHEWIKKNTQNVSGKRFRKTRAIASHTNLTMDRVRYVCSVHEEIYLSTGINEDLWGIYGREQDPPRIRQP